MGLGVVLIILGTVISAAVINDKLGELGELAKADLFGDGKTSGFIVWVGAIIVIGAVFRVLNLPEAGRAIVVLIMVAYLLGNAKLPTQLLEAIKQVGGPGGAGAPAPGGGTSAQ